MTVHEFRILEAMNVASARYGAGWTRDRDTAWWARASQIADAFLDEYGQVLSAVEVAGALREMAKGHPRRRAALVERDKRRPARWRMTDAGVGVLGA